MSGSISVACPAKVNLFLEILARRDDGFHELDTVFQELRLDDTVMIRTARKGIDLKVVGADLPDGMGNLVYRAAKLYLDRFGGAEGLAIRLVKRIPVMAGLGGGSSDAAGTLRGLRDLLHPDLDLSELHDPAARLGSDVPFFLTGGTARATGRGERLRPLTRPEPFWMTLAFPPFGLATKDVYAHVAVLAENERATPDALLAALGDGMNPGPHLMNRLMAAAESLDPRVRGFRTGLQALLRPDEHALLSGSGSTFFVPVADTSRATDLARAVTAAGLGRGLAVRSA